MATAQATTLAVERREAAGSRAARRLRRAGNVPGVLYGGGEEPVAFQVDSRLLRQTLSHAGAGPMYSSDDQSARSAKK